MTEIIINDLTPRKQHVATAGQTIFIYDFPIRTGSDLKIYKRASTSLPIDSTDILEYLIDYSVTGAGTALGGTFILNVGATVGDIVTAVRDIPISRTSDLQISFTNTDINYDFDNGIMMLQQNEMMFRDRALLYPNSAVIEPSNKILPILGAKQLFAKNAANTSIIATSFSSVYDDLKTDLASHVTGKGASMIGMQTPRADTVQDVLGDLTDIADGTTKGFIARTGLGVFVTRTFTGATNQISITNPEGELANPIIYIADNPIIPGIESLTVPRGTTAQRPVTPVNGMIRHDTTLGTMQIYEQGNWQTILSTQTGAPRDATYIVQKEHDGLINEQALNLLPTGIMKSHQTTGVVTTDATTLDLPESGNLYFTTARGEAAALLVCEPIISPALKAQWSDAYSKRVDSWNLPLSVSSNIVSIASATYTDLGVASFSATDFTVTAGAVSLKAGGTGLYWSRSGTSLIPHTAGDDVGMTGTRINQGWFTNLECTNAPTVNTNAVYYATGTDVALADGGTNASLAAVNGGIVYSTATAFAILVAGSAGQILRSGGVAAPVWSTPTFPNTATPGKMLVGDGTNIVLSTPTFPNASATAGKFIISDGTDWIASTPTLPNTAAGTGKILRADGTNWAATASTFADTYTACNLLYASAANVVTGLATAASSILKTDGSGIPSLSTDIPTAVTIGTKYIYRVDGTDVAIADGGTNSSTALANGRMMVSSAGAIVEGTPTITSGDLGGLTSLTVDNLKLDGNTFSSTSGAVNITPFAGSAAVIDSHWSFDGATMTAITDNNTTLTAYAGKAIEIEGSYFDGGLCGIGAVVSGSTLVNTPTYSDGAYHVLLLANLGASNTKAMFARDTSGINAYIFDYSFGDIISSSTHVSVCIDSGNASTTRYFEVRTNVNTGGTGGTQLLKLVEDGSFTIPSLNTANGIVQTTAAGLFSTSATLPNGTLATTQAALDNSTKIATTAYVDAAVSVENLWDRTAGTPSYLLPHTSGDDIGGTANRLHCIYSSYGRIGTLYTSGIQCESAFDFILSSYSDNYGFGIYTGGDIYITNTGALHPTYLSLDNHSSTRTALGHKLHRNGLEMWFWGMNNADEDFYIQRTQLTFPYTVDIPLEISNTTGYVSIGSKWSFQDTILTCASGGYLSMPKAEIMRIIGTSHTKFLNSTEDVASYTYTIPAAGANCSFVMTVGDQIINGAVTLDNLKLDGNTLSSISGDIYITPIFGSNAVITNGVMKSATSNSIDSSHVVGLNDMTSLTIYTGTVDNPVYVVKIDGTGSPNTFTWSRNSGATWVASGVSITGGSQTLELGVIIKFGATTGHTLSDYWIVNISTSYPLTINNHAGTFLWRINNSGEVITATYSDGAYHNLLSVNLGASNTKGMISRDSGGQNAFVFDYSLGQLINSTASIYINIDTNADETSRKLVIGKDRVGNTGGTDLVTILEDGSVQIGVDQSGNAAGGKLSIHGTDNSGTAGPHIRVTTSYDNYPLFHTDFRTHDILQMFWDCYVDSAYTNYYSSTSAAAGNFRFLKYNGAFTIDSCHSASAGNVITWIGRLRILAGETVFNEGAQDENLRVEGTSEAALLLCDAGANSVGIGGVTSFDANYVLQLPNNSGKKAKAYAWDTYSSIEMKEQIDGILTPITILHQLCGVKYRWKPGFGDNGFADQFGFISEDTHPVLSCAAQDGGINIVPIVALLVESAKEIDDKISNLISLIKKAQNFKQLQESL